MKSITEIWDSQKTTSDIIIKTKIDELTPLNCYAARNRITGQYIFIISFSKTIELPNLKQFKFKGVEIFPLELENSVELNVFLLENELIEIFSLLIENIIDELQSVNNEKDALLKILNTILKWKKLFDKINFQGLSLEQQKGLIGELLFIDSLLNHEIPLAKIFNSWTGPEFEDKDFIFGAMGTEIKFTSSKNPSLKITSERQLDNQNLSNLFLTLYTTVETKNNGFSLNSLVEQIKSKIDVDLEALKLFNEKLIIAGYNDVDYDNYNKLYCLVDSYYFNISTEFPKITKNQLALGIYNTSYSIELSALDKFQVDLSEILNLIQHG